MKKIFCAGGLGGLMLMLMVVACTSNGAFGPGTGFLGNIFCVPDGGFDVSTLVDLESGIVVLDNAGDTVSGQSVDLAFGGAVTAANLSDGTTMSTSGDSASTDSSGVVGVAVDCSEVGNDANPCSVNWSTVVDGVTSSCDSSFF